MTEVSAKLAVSVVIPTHNPRRDYLSRVLEALLVQTLPYDEWEVIVVDNGSRVPLKAGAGPRDHETKSLKDQKTQELQATEVDLSWHANARIVREEKLGLTFARLRGFAVAKGELIVMVDDDNVLAPDYLETAVRIAKQRPGLGAFGGKCLPEFEVEPEPWLASVRSGLGLRDLGEAPQLFPEETSGGPRDQELKRLKDEEDTSCQLAVGSWQSEENRRLNTEDCKLRLTEFPDCAPIGAGMVLRSAAARAYAERLDQKTKRRKDQELVTDRKGDSLASGGDNDICLTVIEEGWQVGYLPQLQLTHLVPKGRMTLGYHKRMARDSMKSYVLMLDQHGIRPWPAMARWTYPLRVASDWWRVKPWQGAEQSLTFWGHVGMYEARAAMPPRSSSCQQTLNLQ